MSDSTSWLKQTIINILYTHDNKSLLNAWEKLLEDPNAITLEELTDIVKDDPRGRFLLTWIVRYIFESNTPSEPLPKTP
jgi:hypothetical protein